jgi:hypothetical protein
MPTSSIFKKMHARVQQLWSDECMTYKTSSSGHRSGKMIRRQLRGRRQATVYPMLEDGSYTSSTERVSLYGNTVIYLGKNNGPGFMHGVSWFSSVLLL